MTSYFFRLTTVVALVFLNGFFSGAQTVYNANFANIGFLNANKVHKVGTNGQSAGNKTLYTGVATISGIAIDCIVTTLSITNGTFTLPGSAPSGTIAFDYSSSSGTGMSDNEDRFFAPTFNWSSGGGNAVFRFQFIQGGSYNDTTNTGIPVILQNVNVNTYDIDGNGGTSSNQFNEFNLFKQAQYTTVSGSTIGVSFNSNTGLTKFRSNTTSNTTNIKDDRTRVKLEYSELSSIDVAVGADGSGAAYYFLDFGAGSAWAYSVTTAVAPVVDLDTAASGFGNSSSNSCHDTTSFVSNKNGTNISTSASNLDELRLFFETSDILNGANEKIWIKGATAGGTIALNFTNGASISNVSFGGQTFAVAAIVQNGVSTLSFTRSGGGTIAKSVYEALIDSLRYFNVTGCTLGERELNVTVRAGNLVSNAGRYLANINHALPVELLYFQANCNGLEEVQLKWATASELNNHYFEVERSADGAEWMAVGRVEGAGNSQEILQYSLTDFPGVSSAFYRLRQVDFDGTTAFSDVRSVHCGETEAIISIFPNPSRGMVEIIAPESVELVVFDGLGRVVYRRLSHEGYLFKDLLPGTYFIAASNGISWNYERVLVH